MKVGNWMRNKETNEAVKIRAIGAVMVEYGNDDVDGEVQLVRLADDFDVLDDPFEREDIEFLLKAMIDAGEAETGMYDIGLSYLVVDRIDSDKGEIYSFNWFEHMINFKTVLGDTDNE